MPLQVAQFLLRAPLEFAQPAEPSLAQTAFLQRAPPEVAELPAHCFTPFERVPLEVAELSALTAPCSPPFDRVPLEGAELTFEVAELTAPRFALFYRAPLQARSDGGFFLVEALDLSRQVLPVPDCELLLMQPELLELFVPPFLSGAF